MKRAGAFALFGRATLLDTFIGIGEFEVMDQRLRLFF
jgi:hypothetical protein